MIAAIVVSAFAGLLFGYFLVGPINRSYSPFGYAVVVGFLAFMLGVTLFTALTLASLFNPPAATEPTILAYLLALSFWAVYSGTIALGAYVQQRRRAAGASGAHNSANPEEPNDPVS